MINRYKYKEIIWLDVVSPTREDISKLTKEFLIERKISQELSIPSFKPRAEKHGDCIYLILHFPAYKHSHKDEGTRQEIDFVIGKNFLITARYDTIDSVEKFSKIVEVNQILSRGFEADTPWVLLSGILEEIYGSLMNELEYISTWLEKVEKQIFAGKEKNMVIEISEISRNLLTFKKSIDYHHDVLHSLKELGIEMFGHDSDIHMRDILDAYAKVEYSLRNSMQLVAEMRETNNSLVSTKQNEIMKTLTIMAFVTFPLTLIASIFSLNTSFIPLVGRPDDFWIVMAIMGTATVLMFIFFKVKKWL